MRFVAYSSRTSAVASVGVLLLLATGCSVVGSDDDAEELLLTRDQSSYQAENSVTLRLVNETRAAVGYNLCNSELQVRDEGQWSTLEVARTCTLVLKMLEPGQRATYEYPLPEHAGDSLLYRLQTTVQVPAADGEVRARTLHTQPFTIDTVSE